MPQVTLISPATRQTQNKLRVCAYCRVSSDSKDQLNSYARQIQVYTDTIRRHSDWEMVEIFADEGISGTASNNRTQFQRMIKMCEQKRIDLILTKSISRFARNTKDALEYARKLKLLGIGVQFEKEGINTLSLGDGMLLSTFAAIAQEESVSISQNVRIGIRKRMEMGKYMNGCAPYGYRLVKGEIIPYEPECVVVCQIFQDYLDGESTLEIAEKLNQSHIQSKRQGINWSSDSIKYILTNERYIGNCMYQKFYHEPTVPFQKKINKGELDRFYVSNTHIPILEKSVFDAVQKRLAEQRKKFAHTHQKNIIYPLTSRIQCSECGSFYRRRQTNGGISWGCTQHIQDRTSCDSHYYREERIYDCFIRMMTRLRFGNENILAETIQLLSHAILMAKRNNTQAREAAQGISELNAKLLMLEQLRNKGYLAPEIYQSQAKEIRLQITRLKEQRQSAFESPLESAMEEIKKLHETVRSIKEPLDRFDEQLFQDTVQSIRINNKDEITITLLGGISLTEAL